MAGMLPLLRVTVQHAYFNQGRKPHWRFEPLAACRQIERELGLRRQPEADGMSLWREADPARDAPLAKAAGANTLLLQYAVFCDEPGLHAITDWPVAAPVCYRMQWGDEEVQCAALSDVPQMAVEAAASKAAGLLQEWFMVEIALPEAAIWQADTATGVRQYRIEMHAPAMHWKYFFSGALAQKNIVIVDLDADFAMAAQDVASGEDTAGDPAAGGPVVGTPAAGEIKFLPSLRAASADGKAWVSDQAIALQQVPTRRFQLQEAGMSGLGAGQGGRVLIKRLPNASVKKIGKEVGSDGKELLVAEIYIHQ